MTHFINYSVALFFLVGPLLCSCVDIQSNSMMDKTTFGYSFNGRPIVGSIIDQTTFSAASGTETDKDEAEAEELETLLIFAGIHGNEPLSVSLVNRLIEGIEKDSQLVVGKRLVIVSKANPDGLVGKTRANARGVDLNRNFPSKNWSYKKDGKHGSRAGSEPETKVLIELVERFKPARILSIHSPLHCINFDGPARGVAYAMAKASGYEVKSNIGYETPGSFGNWAGKDKNIPVITLELRRDISEAELWPELGGGSSGFFEIS